MSGLLLCTLLLASPATVPADALIDRLEAVDAKVAQIADLTADFVQEKHSPLLAEPLVTRGTVRALPSAIRWDSGSDERKSVLAVDERALRIWYVSDNVVEVYPIEGNLAAMTASPLPRLADLRASFAIEADAGRALGEGLAIRLVPTDVQLAENIDQVRVLLDENRGVARAFEITDADGEVTLLRFSDIRTNTGLKAADVRLEVPADVKVVRPLGGAE